MYWLAPPPTLRYLAAVAILLVAVVWDLWPESTVQHPFVATDLTAGSPVAGAIEWRPVPKGVLPEVDADGVVLVDVAKGEPLVPSHLGVAPIPAGWWVVALDVPASTPIGTEVRVAVTSPASNEATLIRGVVVSGAADGPGGKGSVAVPEADAGLVAAAAAGGRVTVLAGSR